MRGALPYVLVGVGGFLGANARFVLARWVGALVDTRFPLGTLVVNVSGCFALGVLAPLALTRLVAHSDEVRLAVGVGFLGAFTTFSTFIFETGGFLRAEQWVLATGNVVLHVVVGIVSFFGGVLLVRVL